MCKVVISKDNKCRFLPATKELHVLKVEKNTYSFIFGRQIPDNGTNYRIVIYNTIILERIDEEDNLDNEKMNLTGS